MNREQLADVLRAASQLVDDRPLVMGSQAILGTYEEDVLPAAATMSMEADVAFLDDQDRAKADLVTGAIGETPTSTSYAATTPRESTSRRQPCPRAGATG